MEDLKDLYTTTDEKPGVISEVVNGLVKIVETTPRRKKLEGQGLVEYGLILFFVAVVVVAILIFLGPRIGTIFSEVSKGVS